MASSTRLNHDFELSAVLGSLEALQICRLTWFLGESGSTPFLGQDTDVL